MGNVDPRVIFAMQRDSDALGLLVWRAAPDQVGFAVFRAGEEVVSLPIQADNAVELAVELLGANVGRLAEYAATMPPLVAIGLAGALLAPHASTVMGAAAVVKHAKALERGDGCAESA